MEGSERSKVSHLTSFIAVFPKLDHGVFNSVTSNKYLTAFVLFKKYSLREESKTYCMHVCVCVCVRVNVYNTYAGQ